jgi:hypothetical protein
MEKIKAYTTIEQSKVLAEILPLESADMRYDEYISYIDGTPKVGYKKGVIDGIPCWSLVALLDVLPKEINVLGTIYSINIHTKNEKWFIDYKCNNEEFVGVYSNIFVDACYEMVIKLHELKKL